MRAKPLLIGAALVVAVFVVFLAMTLLVGTAKGPTGTMLASNKVGVIELTGPIVESRKIVEQLIRFRNNGSIDAIILRIDSPGGAVGPSQEIYDEVRRTVDYKPVVASMGSVAASGGYYVAAPCSQVLANPGTLTGSIGVIMQFADLRELLGKIGVGTRVIKSGKFKDVGSTSREMTEEERALLQAVIDDAHSQFVAAVAEGRKLDPEKVKTFADGRIFTGRQAQQLGLVDRLGGLQEAVRTASELAGLKGAPQLVYPKEEKPKLVDFLLENVLSAAVKELRSHENIGLHYYWRQDVSGRFQ